MVTSQAVECVERGRPWRSLAIVATVLLASTPVLWGCGESSEPDAAGDTIVIPSAAASSTTVQTDTTSSASGADTSRYSAATTTAVTTVKSINAPATATSGAERELELDAFGFFVPEGWTPQYSAVIGSQFQAEAEDCVSAEVIDDPAPSDSGSPALERAAVQICIVDRNDELTLEQWLTQRGQADFQPVSYGTCPVLSLPGTPEQQLAYAQLGEVRAEISTTVTTTDDMAEQRRAEVADLLENMRCTTN